MTGWAAVVVPVVVPGDAVVAGVPVVAVEGEGDEAGTAAGQ